MHIVGVALPLTVLGSWFYNTQWNLFNFNNGSDVNPLDSSSQIVYISELCDQRCWKAEKLKSWHVNENQYFYLLNMNFIEFFSWMQCVINAKTKLNRNDMKSAKINSTNIPYFNERKRAVQFHSSTFTPIEITQVNIKSQRC